MKENKFYVYSDGISFVNINDKELPFVLKKTKNINKASYWTNKKHAKSWEKKITNSFPDMKLTPAYLTLTLNQK